MWLYRVATNTALSWYRHRVRTPQATVALPEFDDAAASEVFIDRDADPERRCVARLMAARVLRRVSRLPRLRRAALVTQVRTGSPREGAEVLGLNYDTFKSRVWRARRDLAGWD